MSIIWNNKNGEKTLIYEEESDVVDFQYRGNIVSVPRLNVCQDERIEVINTLEDFRRIIPHEGLMVFVDSIKKFYVFIEGKFRSMRYFDSNHPSFNEINNYDVDPIEYINRPDTIFNFIKSDFNFEED